MHNLEKKVKANLMQKFKILAKQVQFHIYVVMLHKIQHNQVGLEV